MVIDIDSFLDNMKDTDVQTDDDEKSVEEKITLDFQKDVEDKIAKIQEKGISEDFKALKQIYDEVKAFDEDLPNKFTGIETKGRFALKELGTKYTDEFVQINKNNAKILLAKIEGDLKILDQHLSEYKFTEGLDLFKIIIQNFSYFPKSFLKERLVLATRIKNKEVEIYDLIDKHRDEKKVEIQKKLNYLAIELKKAMLKENLSKVEELSGRLQHVIDQIPRVLLGSFITEKAKTTKILIYTEDYLVKKYEIRFNRAEKMLNILFDKFHEYYLNKNLNQVLMIYNEILLKFKIMPDYFIDRKIKHYKEINTLYGMLNKLIINNNMQMFMETYEFSKKVDSIRAYLTHIAKSKNVNYDNLLTIREKLKKFPAKYELERNELNAKINKLIEIHKPYEPPKEIENQSTQNNNTFNQNHFDEIQNRKHHTECDEILNDITAKNQAKAINDAKPIQPKKIMLNQKKAPQKVSLEMLKEIDLHFQKLKSSSDPKEIKMYYKKIIFYLNHTPLKPVKKSDILKKVNAILKQKQLV